MDFVNFDRYNDPKKAQRVFSTYVGPTLATENPNAYAEAIKATRTCKTVTDLDIALDRVVLNHRSVHFCGNPFDLRIDPAESSFVDTNQDREYLH